MIEYEELKKKQRKAGTVGGWGCGLTILAILLLSALSHSISDSAEEVMLLVIVVGGFAALCYLSFAAHIGEKAKRIEKKAKRIEKQAELIEEQVAAERLVEQRLEARRLAEKQKQEQEGESS